MRVLARVIPSYRISEDRAKPGTRRAVSRYFCAERNAREMHKYALCACRSVGRPSTSASLHRHVPTRCSPDLFRAVDSARKIVPVRPESATTRVRSVCCTCPPLNRSSVKLTPFLENLIESSRECGTCSSGASMHTEGRAKCKNIYRVNRSPIHKSLYCLRKFMRIFEMRSRYLFIYFSKFVYKVAFIECARWVNFNISFARGILWISLTLN